MVRRPPRSTRTAHSFPTRRSSDLLDAADSDAPVITAMAAPWPWAAEAHTRNLEVPSKDYAGWFGATRPLPKADEDALRAHLAELETLINTPELQDFAKAVPLERSEEHTSELQSLMRISYAV